MEKKFLIKFMDGVIRGPFLQSEIEDMIYSSSINGEEQICEYPDGLWVDIAKDKHFYDVFIGAFEVEKNVRRDDKDTFIDSPTATNVRKKTEEAAEKTRVVELDKKKRPSEKTKSSESTQLYNQEDIKNISESLITPKKDGVIDPDQKSPIIPQAVIVSLDDDEEDKQISKLKLALIASVILVAGVIGYFLTNNSSINTINIDGVKFEKIFIEITLPVAESSSHSPKEAAIERNEATKLLKKDDISSYKKAVQMLLEAYELDTTNYTTLSYIAYAYAKLYPVSKQDGEYTNALKAILSRAEKTDTNIQTSTMAKMAFAISQRDYSGAMVSFNEMLATVKDPSQIRDELLIIAAEASIGQNDYNAAFQVLNNRVNKNNSTYPRAFYLQGIIRINNKEYELAAADFKNAILINPNHATSQVKLYELGKNSTMSSMFDYLKEKYLMMDFSDISTMLYLIANTFVQTGQVDKAKHFYERSLDFYASNPKAMVAYEQLGGNIAKYKKEIMPSYNANPETVTFMLRGDELFRQQKYRDACLQYRMASSLEPQNINALYKLGEAYRLSYEFVKAVDAFNEALKIDKLHLDTLIKISRVQSDLYQFQEALTNLDKAQKIDPENPDVLFTIGYISEKRNIEKTAVEYYHKTVAKDFSHTEALFALGRINYKYERYPEAKLLFEKIVSAKPDNYDSYVYITMILGKTEHISKVEKYSASLEKMFPEIAEISTGLALAYINNSSFIEAEKELKKGLSKNKYSIVTLKAYAELSEKLGRTKDALSYYETIAIIAPYYLDAIKKRADIYCGLGQLASCEHELLKLVDLTPGFPKAYYTLGKMYYGANQFEDAKEALLREIQYNPSIRDSYLLLGDTYIKMGKPLDAIDLFRKLLNQNKKDAYAMLGLAKAYYASRDFEAAENTVTQARHIDPNINDIYYLKCILYFEMKMFGDAKEYCEEYVKRSPDDEKANEAREKISKITQ